MNLLDRIKKTYNKVNHKFKRIDYEISEKNYKRLLSDIYDIEKTSNSGLEVWEKNRKILRNYIFEKDIRDFLNWDIVQDTMFFEAPLSEYEKIKVNKQLFWAIKESKIGNPRRYYVDKNTSGNLIIHAIHLSKILDKVDIKNIENIVEFGGGYGSMCRLLRNMGYKKDYVLVDLPEFLALQRFYLAEINEDYLEKTEFVGNFEDLKRREKTLLIATWSLSETGVDVRKSFLDSINFDYCLIGLRGNFSGIDNVKYFKDFMNKYPKLSFEFMETGYIENNYYLIGTKK